MIREIINYARDNSIKIQQKMHSTIMEGFDGVVPGKKNGTTKDRFFCQWDVQKYFSHFALRNSEMDFSKFAASFVEEVAEQNAVDFSNKLVREAKQKGSYTLKVGAYNEDSFKFFLDENGQLCNHFYCPISISPL